MDIRPITPRYAVSPQISPEDLATIRDAGFTTVICNRPDGENPESLQAAQMEAAAREAGLNFVIHPLTHQTMTPENVAIQMQAVEASPGPVLAYCASGTRCSVVWSLGSAAAGMPVDEVLGAVSKAGYDLSQLRPRLEELSG